MRLLLIGLLLSAATFTSTAADTHPSNAGKRLMLLVSKGLPGLIIYDADSQKPLCQATMGIAPHEAAFSLDGEYAYIPVYGNSGVGKPGTDEHMIHFIRTSDCQEVGSLDTGEYKRPHCVVVGKSGRLYVTAEIAASVIIIDPNARKIMGTIPTGSHTTHMIALTKDEKTIYTSNVQSKTLSVLDVPNCKLAQTIPTEGENQRMTLSPDERWFVTSLGPAKKIAFYRTSDKQLDFTVPVEGEPFTAKFSTDGKYLYDFGQANGSLIAWKIDVAQRKVVATADKNVGRGEGSLEVNPFTGDVYITDAASSKISILDPVSWTVTKSISTAKTPDCMDFVTVR